MHKLSVVTAAILCLVVGYAVGATRNPNLVKAVAPKVTLTMNDGRGHMEVRTYDVTYFNYNPNLFTMTIINPTLYRCGFEP